MKACLRRRVKWLTWIFIIGLVVSGATAIPLQAELDLAGEIAGRREQIERARSASGLARWILQVREALHDTGARYPFLAYGTDWLAFGHFVIAVVFIGALTRSGAQSSGCSRLG